MQRVLCQCASCDESLGNFVNLWTQVGKGYCSPAIDGEKTENLVAQGSVRDGEKGTLVANCTLQNLACARCQRNIGIKCVSTPVNHVLKNNQILIRQAAVRIKSTRGSKEVELKIQRVLKLKDPSNPASAAQPPASPTSRANSGPVDKDDGTTSDGAYTPTSAAHVDVERLQADLDLQREDIDRIDSAAYRVVSSFDGAVSRIDREMQKLNQTMEELRQDMNSSKGEVQTLESGLSTLKANIEDKGILNKLEDQMGWTQTAVSAAKKVAMSAKSGTADLQAQLQATRAELQSLRDETTTLRQEVKVSKQQSRDALSASSKEWERQFMALRAEMSQMRDTAAHDRSRRPEAPKAAYPIREFDIITSSLTKIGNEAGQVGSLRMEFDLFKPRMERLEARMDSWEESGPRPGSANEDTISLHRSVVDMSHHLQSTPPIQPNIERRKRPLAMSSSSFAELETPSKRVGYLSGRRASSPQEDPVAHTRQPRGKKVPGGSGDGFMGRPPKSAPQEQSYRKPRSAKSRAKDALNDIYTPPDD